MRRRQEIVQYIFWGVVSAVLNIGLFQTLVMLGVNYKWANIGTLIIVKIFCYITNKIFVFKTPFSGLVAVLKELSTFLIARGITSLFDLIGVIVLVEKTGLDTLMSKSVMAIIVIVMNYILSKMYVFKRG